MSRDRKLLGALAAVAVVAIWFVAVWLPRSNAIAAADQRRTTAVSQAGALRLELARLAAARSEQAATATSLERVKTAIPDTADLPGLLTGINDAAISAGVRVVGVTPAPLVAGTPTAVPFTLNVTGGYFAVVSFARQLTSLPRLVVLDTVQLSAGQRGGDLTVGLGGRAFTAEVPATTATTTPTTAPTPAVAK